MTTWERYNPTLGAVKLIRLGFIMGLDVDYMAEFMVKKLGVKASVVMLALRWYGQPYPTGQKWTPTRTKRFYSMAVRSRTGAHVTLVTNGERKFYPISETITWKP